ncbi:hypothetical protein MOV08_01935 [Streptomyces yunnanensis]|uniref:Uncharacterized protein n=1 Tax=Streptomyces yunnanensis TaxID=156453 RepID=A0ABY8APN9_9ACTN|nr:hypothetical protein [Streptomyces yunnanensis]WEB46124.1 hypothetical protein MOV08_01935 [Streptomyces yunnanensis]
MGPDGPGGHRGRAPAAPCDSPLPDIRVGGRAGDILTFPAFHQNHVRLAPLAFGALFDRTPGVVNGACAGTESPVDGAPAQGIV